MEGFEILGMVPYEDAVVKADMEGQPPYMAFPRLLEEMGKVADALLKRT